MREAQDQPSCVICEPGPGTPPLTWQGLGATFREDHKTCLFLQKKKKSGNAHHKISLLQSIGSLVLVLLVLH